MAPVSVPGRSALAQGTPTGIVFISSTDFVLPGGSSANLVVAGTDGIISGWSSDRIPKRVVDKSATSSYTGLALAADGANNFLYAANFAMGKIDVFNKSFSEVSKPFTDPSLPVGYSPFNIQNVGGQLYVTYAKVDKNTHEEEKGAGLGYVNIFNPNGELVRRFISRGALNAPWGIAQAPAGFLKSNSRLILIGNFGDGRINAYDPAGNLLGALKTKLSGADVEIDGLWAISFAPSSAPGVNPMWLFFSAGPGNETQGLFGYLK
jgi:uncharacterized protein (TIGR03118 family)